MISDEYQEGVCRYCGVSYWRSIGEIGEMICPDCQALEEDEADMARIAREWSEYDRDPQGS